MVMDTTAEATLLDALVNDRPITEEMEAATRPSVLAVLALAAMIGPDLEPLPTMYLPRTAEEFREPWPPPPIRDPGVTPPIVYLLAYLSGDKAADRLAETVNCIHLGWLVVRLRQQPPTSDPIGRLETIRQLEWDRLRDHHTRNTP